MAVMQFTPAGNGSATCAGVAAYNAARPTGSDSFYQANLGLFIYSIIFWVLAMVVLEWRGVASPRLGNYMLAFAIMLLSVALCLNLAVTNVPCGLFAFCLLAGLGGAAIHFYMLLVRYVVETYFATHAAGKMRVFQGEEDNTAATTGTRSFSGRDSQSAAEESHAPTILMSKAESLWIFAKFAVGITSLDSLPALAFARLRSDFASLTLVVTLPCVISFVAIIASMPVYRECNGCALFLEPFIAFMVSFFAYVIAAIRAIYAARKADLVDRTSGIISQLVFVLAFASPFGVAGIILGLLDPAEASYQRIFPYFEWFWFFSMHIQYAWAMIGEPLRKARQEYRLVHEDDDASVAGRAFLPGRDSSRQVTTTSTIGDHTPRKSTNPRARNQIGFIAVIESDSKLRAEFEAHVAKQYAIESLYFLDDVRTYKNIQHRKNDVWRRNKARMLLNTYIQNGAPMEINVSHNSKLHLIYVVQVFVNEIQPKAGDENINIENVVAVFEEAAADVAQEVLQGMWVQFQAAKRRALKEANGSRGGNGSSQNQISVDALSNPESSVL